MLKNQINALDSIKNVSAEQLFTLSLAISPLFLLTVSGWMTRIVAVCALLAIYVFFRNKSYILKSADSYKNAFDIKLLSITFSLPIIAILLGQSFRGQFAWDYYDSPLHILICIFVIWAMLKNSPRVVELLSYIFPIVTLLALANIVTHPNLFWGATRLSTQAVDPLEFGSLSLTFGLMSLISIKLHRHYSKLLILYKLIGFGSGIYLSIASGSRTGWLAIPIIGLIWIYFDNGIFTFKKKFIAGIGIITVIIFSYFLSTTVQQRAEMAANEISNYHWNDQNKDSSVGARISFARIAVFLLEKKPLSGWGDGNFESVINDSALDFAEMPTKMTALTAGFHNDITANMVRSGIWGLISTLALFFIPAIFFVKNLRSANKKIRDVAFLALAFLTCQFISSLSMEVLNLRYSASFYGLTLAIFCGQILFYKSHDAMHFNGRIS
ncbi:O-antigen ligase [Methylotenera sp.]|uniref:O-antigen ligase family protein n=1 Tax=Methylotenera sp. TaxID=2051956 RepID=UPI002489CE40|nr:O-antigen ligase family protein [Methylotenera sp.]MDI1362012.1 O-antigen ligase family protein [Methylotenera sp.]